MLPGLPLRSDPVRAKAAPASVDRPLMGRSPHIPGVLLRAVMLWSAGCLTICVADGADLAPASTVPVQAHEASPASQTETFPNLEAIRNAAAAGSASAQFKLGDYLFTRGDFTNAVIYYRQAAEQGLIDAQLSLSSCYAHGRGVAPDRAESVRWSRLAARQLRRQNVPGTGLSQNVPGTNGSSGLYIVPGTNGSPRVVAAPPNGSSSAASLETTSLSALEATRPGAVVNNSLPNSTVPGTPNMTRTQSVPGTVGDRGAITERVRQLEVPIPELEGVVAPIRQAPTGENAGKGTAALVPKTNPRITTEDQASPDR